MEVICSTTLFLLMEFELLSIKYYYIILKIHSFPYVLNNGYF